MAGLVLACVSLLVIGVAIFIYCVRRKNKVYDLPVFSESRMKEDDLVVIGESIVDKDVSRDVFEE